jgi:predicted Rossmann-fold nucleotide-binding protein
MIQHRNLIGVIGSGNNSYHSLSFPLGQWLAENGFHLLNGGGRGVMAETAQAFTAVTHRKGVVVGILPASDMYNSAEERKEHSDPPGYPNPFTEIVIRTHLPSVGAQGHMQTSRNHIIVLSADFIFALPGSYGTQTEIELALEYGKPLVIVSPDEEWEEFSDRTVVVSTIQSAVTRLQEFLENR